MKDKLAEEILAKFIEKLDYTYRYKTINERKNIINELRYLMQAYHEAKMKEVTDEDIHDVSNSAEYTRGYRDGWRDCCKDVKEFG